MATRGFLPHGYCLQWEEQLVGLMVGSDLAIAAAYYSIPAALVIVYRRKPQLHFGWLFVLFSLFIFSCGTTHVVSLLNIWWPMYWVEAYAKAFTAAVSVGTALLLWPLIPRIVRLPSTRELESLVQRLEQEVAERRRAESALQALTAELEQRVQDRTRALEAEIAERLRLQEADKAREVAERASQAKSAFLSRMSHELRTPLNAVLGFARLLQRPDSAQDAATVVKWSGHVERAGNHLLRLVEDVLDIGRIESGQAVPQAETVDIAEVAAECQSMILPAAEAAGVRFTLEVPAPLQGVTDGRRLRQVLLNLLMNGVKYNRPGGTLVLAIEPLDPAHLKIVVTDSGIGMSAAQLAGLYQPFNRLGRERGTVDGVGLGLVVVKNVVDLVGGVLEVQSAEGQGTRFTLLWPVASDTRAGAAATR